MSKKTKVGEKRKDDQYFGTCPYCQQMCWCTQKKDIYIIDLYRKTEDMYHRYKCTKCGHQYVYLCH